MVLYSEFEDKLGELKNVQITDFIKEARLLASYDDSLSTWQLALIYNKFNIQFTTYLTIYA